MALNRSILRLINESVGERIDVADVSGSDGIVVTNGVIRSVTVWNRDHQVFYVTDAGQIHTIDFGGEFDRYNYERDEGLLHISVEHFGSFTIHLVG